MDTLFRPVRWYRDFEPQSKWIEQDGSHTLLVFVEGFTNEHVRLDIDDNGNLHINGVRWLGGKQWSRFEKEIRLPKNCDIHEMNAKLEDGVIHVTIPKVKTPADESKPKSTMEAPTKTRASEPKSKTVKAGKAPEEEEKKERSDGSYDDANKVRKELREKEEKAESVDIEKIKNAAKENGKVTNNRISEEDEKGMESVVRKEMKDFTTEKGSGTDDKFTLESSKEKSGQLMTNVAVAALLILGFGVYVAYKIGS